MTVCRYLFKKRKTRDERIKKNLNVVVSDSVENTKIGIPVEVIKTEIKPSNEVIQGDYNSIQAQLWVCEDCDLRYKYYTSYLNHMDREHPDQLEGEDDTGS